MYTAHQDADSGYNPCVRDADGETIATCQTMTVASMIANALNNDEE